MGVFVLGYLTGVLTFGFCFMVAAQVLHWWECDGDGPA